MPYWSRSSNTSRRHAASAGKNLPQVEILHNQMFIVKFPVIVVVYVATSLVNKDEYTVYSVVKVQCPAPLIIGK